MASTITLDRDYLINIGNRNMTKGTGNLGTYESGGVAVTPKQLGLGLIEHMDIASVNGYIFNWDKATGKILAYQSDDAVDPLDEVGSTDISASVFRWTAIGY